MDLLREPEGGSLNAARADAFTIVKSYDGTIPRGHAKLRREYEYLIGLPASARAHFAAPQQLQIVRDRADRPLVTRLVLERHDAPAVAKAILCGDLSPQRTGDIVAKALDILLTTIYPVRTRRAASGLDVFEACHGARITAALDALGRYPELAEIITAPEVIVNGLVCPSLPTAAAFLRDHAAHHFCRSMLVAAHGDCHLDNVLATTDGDLKVIFVDPRGDAFLPPHYDFAKMAKAVRAGYDCVHYGKYDLHVDSARDSLTIDLNVDQRYNAHYGAALQSLIARIPAYAAAEQVSQGALLQAAQAAEVAHVISFAWYHANRPGGMDVTRVRAFLATASLLARRLMHAVPPITALREPLLTPQGA